MQSDRFNFDAALARLAGDTELFQELATFFLEDAPSLCAQIRAGLRDNDARVIERAAHSLKDLAANFDAHDAVESARSLERMARQRNLTELPQAWEHLSREITALQEALVPYRC